jgi:hypothetical protein
LASLVGVAVVVRLRAHVPPDVRADSGSAAASADLTSGAASGKGGTLADNGTVRAVVREGAARTLHGDARRTHRARGRGPREPTVAWSVDVGGPVEAQVTTSPDERTLYAASLGGKLTAISREGSVKWSVDLGDRVYGAPCVADDGTVYVGNDGGRFSAISSDGRVLWRLETGADADTGAVIAPNGQIVLAAGQTVMAVRAGGDVAWRFQAKKKVFTAPAWTEDGLVVFGSQDHRVYALTAAGALAWSADLGADVDGAPAIGEDGAIFVGTDGDEVARLDTKGNVVWRANVGGFVRGPLSVARNGDVLAGVYGPSPLPGAHRPRRRAPRRSLDPRHRRARVRRARRRARGRRRRPLLWRAGRRSVRGRAERHGSLAIFDARGRGRGAHASLGRQPGRAERRRPGLFAVTLTGGGGCGFARGPVPQPSPSVEMAGRAVRD